MWHPSCFSLALPFTLFSPIPPFFSTLPFFCQQFLTDYLLRAGLFQVLEITVVGERDKSTSFCWLCRIRKEKWDGWVNVTIDGKVWKICWEGIWSFAEDELVKLRWLYFNPPVTSLRVNAGCCFLWFFLTFLYIQCILLYFIWKNNSEMPPFTTLALGLFIWFCLSHISFLFL